MYKNPTANVFNNEKYFVSLNENETRIPLLSLLLDIIIEVLVNHAKRKEKGGGGREEGQKEK